MENQLREMVIEYNNLSNPDGSAILCQGNTVIQASVYGPVEVSSAREKPEKALLSVIFKPKCCSVKYDLKVKIFEEYLYSVFQSIIYCDLHPRTSISIIIQEIQDDGCLLSASVNAACCALLDAGIPIKCLVSSSTLIIDKDNYVRVDPDSETFRVSLAHFVLTFESINNNLLSIINEGSFVMNQLKEVIKLGQIASKEIFEIYKESMKKRFLFQ